MNYTPHIHSNGFNHGPTKTVKASYHLTSDPVFYVTVAFFALLTTGLPGLMGQPNFMPITQALGLTIFTAIALRRGEVGNALRVALLWIVVQLLVMLSITWLVPGQAERAIHEGFTYRTALLQWAYTGDNLPRSLLVAPLSRAGEILGVLLGSLLTGGLVGSWFLVRAVDLLGYAAGSLVHGVVPGLGLLLGLAPWRLLAIAGYTGFFILLAQPILINRWRPRYYLEAQRRLIVWSGVLLILGLLLELMLPGLWQTIWEPG